MPVTRFGLEGYGVRRAGSFSGKTPDSGAGPHPVGILTRFGLEGYGVRRAGDFSGKTSTEAPPPPPTGQGGAGSGADSQVDWRWYEGQELRPNWYEYPQEVKRLRAQIARAKKRKKKLERSLSFARGADDLQQRLDAVAKLEERLQRLLALWRVAEQEADEFMELITEIL